MSRFKTKRDTLDALFSEYIRARDGKCMRCGSRSRRLECSHIFSRRHQTTRLDPDNALAMCHTCHRFWHENPVDAGGWIRELLGSDFIDALRFKAMTPGKRLKDFERKLKRDELKQMIADLPEIF